MISKLKCRVCDKCKSTFSGQKNFNDKWIVGAESLKTNNIRDHASSEQHQEAMLLEKRSKHRKKEPHFFGVQLRNSYFNIKSGKPLLTMLLSQNMKISS